MSGRVLPSSTVRRESDLLAQELDDEIVMANVETGMYFGLDDVGRQIWLLLEQPRPVAAICADLIEQYSVDPTTCERDVLAFLNELAAEGIVHVGEAA